LTKSMIEEALKMFQSLFLWNPHFNSYSFRNYNSLYIVSILVFMEPALQHTSITFLGTL